MQRGTGPRAGESSGSTIERERRPQWRHLTVFGTYASLRVLLEAPEGVYDLRPPDAFDLVIVDEAHRTSGALGVSSAPSTYVVRRPPREPGLTSSELQVGDFFPGHDPPTPALVPGDTS